MSDVFLSYKREDETRVVRLVRALEKHGFSVWWDRGLPGAEDWRARLEAQLDATRCVVVVWTDASTGPQGGFVRDEAARGMGRGILVPVLLDKVRPPLGFGELQAIDLTGWRGSPRNAFFQDLVAAIRAKLAGQPVPAPKGPMRRIHHRMLAGGLTTALVVAGGAFANNTFYLQDRICESADWLSDSCGALGLGGRPSRAERLAWEERPRGECNALRMHLQRFPEGAYRVKANVLLDARRITAVDRWQPVQRQLALYVGRDATPVADEPAARTAALERGRSQAERLCLGFAATALAHYQTAEIRPQEWTCLRVHGGSLCGFDGFALCSLEEKSVSEQEYCDDS